uniref:Uncharacterized protein n=1 Tax=Haptolina ericina TaxID=156174 RepID=A0A7S3FFW1_9EUKA|mmetsp:Transcript_69121/g.154193  ORF Transcript_69121/g.154193 Transcript_69121/m.154193 type:complete len:369 (+) Transcript_69121:220-1326(+)
MYDNLNFYAWDGPFLMSSYVSFTRCGFGVNGTNVTGGCVTGGQGAATYWHCPFQGPVFESFASFALPPYEMHKACEENSLCVGFSVNPVGSHGTLYRATPLPNQTLYPATRGYSGTFLKLPTNAHQQTSGSSAAELTSQAAEPQASARDTRASSIPAPPGFIAFAGVDFRSYTTMMIGGPTPSSPWQYNQDAYQQEESIGGVQPRVFVGYGLNASEIAVILAASSKTVNSGLYTYVDQPSRPPDGYPYVPPPSQLDALTWNAWAYREDNNLTMFVNSQVCVPMQGSQCCAAIAGKSCLVHRCAGINTSAPLIQMQSYDLPARIMATACVYHGCHAFMMNAANTKGTMYYWPWNHPNRSVNGYLQSYLE